jgi:hypothetical protein
MRPAAVEIDMANCFQFTLLKKMLSNCKEQVFKNQLHIAVLIYPLVWAVLTWHLT